MCGFGGRHNLTLSSSSWGSGSGFWAASQKKSHFQGDVGAHIWTLPIREGGWPRELCLLYGVSPAVPAGASPSREGMVPAVCGPPGMQAWSTDWKTRMLRPQVQWGQSVSIAPDNSPTLRKPRGWEGPITKLPCRSGRPVLTSYTLKQAGQGRKRCQIPFCSPCRREGEWTQGGQDQVKPAFLKPRVIKPHAELLNTQMSRHLFLRN